MMKNLLIIAGLLACSYVVASAADDLGADVANCSSITVEADCCSANCSFCLASEAVNGSCINSTETCPEPTIDSCAKSVSTTAAPSTTGSPSTTVNPPTDCGNFTTQELCCNSTDTPSCFFCQAPGTTNGTCGGDQCEEGETDICSSSPPTTVAPTTTTSSTTTEDGGSSGQQFDGASFIGGIVLCGGLVAIVFFGLKFYKARKDQNYHTL